MGDRLGIPGAVDFCNIFAHSLTYLPTWEPVKVFALRIAKFSKLQFSPVRLDAGRADANVCREADCSVAKWQAARFCK